MKNKKFALLLPVTLFSLLTTPAINLAQTTSPVTGDAATYSLRPTWKPGETARYKMMVHRTADKKRFDLDIVDSVFRITVLQTIRDTQPEGAVVMVDTTEEASGKFDGREMELTNAIPKMTLTRDKTGEVTVDSKGGVDIVREPITQLFRLTARMQRGFTPPAPVRIGESWNFSWQDTGLVVGTTKGKGVLVGPGTWNGQPTWKVKVEYDANVNATDPRTGNKTDVVFHFTGTADMDTKNFQILQLTGNGEEHLPDNETAKTEVELTRLPAKPEDKEKRRQGNGNRERHEVGEKTNTKDSKLWQTKNRNGATAWKNLGLSPTITRCWGFRSAQTCKTFGWRGRNCAVALILPVLRSIRPTIRQRSPFAYGLTRRIRS